MSVPVGVQRPSSVATAAIELTLVLGAGVPVVAHALLLDTAPVDARRKSTHIRGLALRVDHASWRAAGSSTADRAARPSTRLQLSSEGRGAAARQER